MKNKEIKPVCDWKNKINEKCCDSRWIEECSFCMIIRNKVSKKVIETLCLFWLSE